MDKAKRATEKWAEDVDQASADLIEQGMSPWKARMKAEELVRERRKRKKAGADDETVRKAVEDLVKQS